jgi:hypothetical protein
VTFVVAPIPHKRQLLSPRADGPRKPCGALWVSQSERMSKPKDLPTSLGNAFTYAEGLLAGATPRRLRNSGLNAPYRGVRSISDLSDTVSRARAYAPLLSPDQYFSHLTAAELLGLRMPEGFVPRSLHVTSFAPLRAPRREGVMGHQSQRGDTVLVDGLRVSAPVAAWIQSATYLLIDDLIVMGDTLVRRRAPFTTLDDVKREAAAHRHERGARRIGAALPQLRPRTDSARETMLRLILERAGFPEPAINGEILNSFGAVIAHGDLVYRRYRTIVEYDGGHHRTDERQFTIDIERLDQLAEERWRVIRVGRNLMWQRAVLLGKVATALESGGWQATDL